MSEINATEADQHERVMQSRNRHAMLKRNNCHGFRAIHTKGIMQTNHVQLKARISHAVLRVAAVGDSGHSSG